MAKYLIAFLILAAGGVTLLAVGGDNVDETSFAVELIRAETNTRTLHLTEPTSYALASLTWSGSDDLKGFIVEKMVGDDFFILDTVSPSGSQMVYHDPDTLPSGQTAVYRLSALHKGRVYALETYSVVPFSSIAFTVPDTVIPVDGEVTLEWNAFPDIEEYEVKVMTLGSLAPVPMGETVEKGVVTPQDGKVTWKFSSEDFEEETDLILEVAGRVEQDIKVQEITGYRLFVLGTEPEEEQK